MTLEEAKKIIRKSGVYIDKDIIDNDADDYVIDGRCTDELLEAILVVRRARTATTSHD